MKHYFLHLNTYFSTCPPTKSIKLYNNKPVVNKVPNRANRSNRSHTYTMEGTTLFKIVLGLILGIAAVICVLGSYFLDEITKVPGSNSIAICGREELKECSGNFEKCEDALIYGYNIDGTGIAGDDDITITDAKFKPLCDLGSEDSCTQLDAGLTFQILNIASMAFGGLGLFVLLIPDTRHGTVALFIFGAVTAAAAFGGFLFVLR